MSSHTDDILDHVSNGVLRANWCWRSVLRNKSSLQGIFQIPLLHFATTMS